MHIVASLLLVVYVCMVPAACDPIDTVASIVGTKFAKQADVANAHRIRIRQFLIDLGRNKTAITLPSDSMQRIAFTRAGDTAGLCNTQQARECFANAFAEIHARQWAQTTRIDCAHYETYLFCYDMDAMYGGTCVHTALTAIAAEEYIAFYRRQHAMSIDDLLPGLFNAMYKLIKTECGTCTCAQATRRTQSHTASDIATSVRTPT
jgi:hypothetical protein